MKEPVRIWTFIITGGDECLTITLPNNPALVHNGRMTVWKLMGTTRLAEAAQTLIRASGSDVICTVESQTEEQTEERKALLGFNLV